MPDYPPVKEFDWTSKCRLILSWNSIDGYQTQMSSGGVITPEVGDVLLKTHFDTNDYTAIYPCVGLPFATSSIKKITVVTDITAFADDNNRDFVMGLHGYVTCPPEDVGAYLRFYINSANKLYIASSDETDYNKVDTGVIVPSYRTGTFKIVYTPLGKGEFYYNNVLVGTLITYLPSFVIVVPAWCIVTLSGNTRQVRIGSSYLEIEGG